MTPEDLEKYINQNGDATWSAAAVLHPKDTMALNTYGTQAAMANAVLNS